FVSATRRPLRPSLFPYTTLFRSRPLCPGFRSPGPRLRLLRVPPLHSRLHPPPVQERRGAGPAPGHLAQLGLFAAAHGGHPDRHPDRKSTRLNSSHVKISYAVFCF